ncbi:hypothetical protein ACC735_38425, partial [Rhizobium ruizarguesonis]
PEGFDAAISTFKNKLAETKPTVATRKSSEDALEVINGFLPETLGGSADLTPSNNTKTSQMHSITPTDFATRFDRYVGHLKDQFGEIGDLRITVM